MSRCRDFPGLQARMRLRECQSFVRYKEMDSETNPGTHKSQVWGKQFNIQPIVLGQESHTQANRGWDYEQKASPRHKSIAK